MTRYNSHNISGSTLNSGSSTSLLHETKQQGTCKETSDEPGSIVSSHGSDASYLLQKDPQMSLFLTLVLLVVVTVVRSIP